MNEELFFSILVLIGGLICVIFASKIGRAMHNYRVERAKELYKKNKYTMARIVAGGSPEELMKINPQFYVWLLRILGVFFLIISGLMMLFND